MRISDWSSDVCSSDLTPQETGVGGEIGHGHHQVARALKVAPQRPDKTARPQCGPPDQPPHGTPGLAGTLNELADRPHAPSGIAGPAEHCPVVIPQMRDRWKLGRASWREGGGQ